MDKASRSLSAAQMVILAAGVLGAASSGPLMAAATAVPALAMSFWRTALGALAVAPVSLVRRRGELTHLSRRDLSRIGLSGLMLAGHFAAWVSALKLTSVASATALVSLQAAWVVLLSRLAGFPITSRVWAGLAFAFAGVMVVSGVDLTVSRQALAGDLLALVGGLFGAVYVVVGSRLRRVTSTPTYAVACYGVSACVLLVASLLGGVRLSGFSAHSWLLIVGVSLSAQLVGHTAMNFLLARVSATVVSLALLLEVPGASLLAAAFLHQSPPVAVYAGLALVCVGLAAVVRSRTVTYVEAPLD
ncbi:MAG: DMT family transporter [Nocardioidaceae bacterium]